MRTNQGGVAAGAGTFTQLKRRDQLADCAIDAIVELGFQGTSVAEVARRAEVSKGVVTYHFPAKDDLIFAAAARIFDSMKEHMAAAQERQPVTPETFVAAYITVWVEYYRTHTRYMIAIAEIWANFRDKAGQRHFGPATQAGELAEVERFLKLGQASGHLGDFSARVMAVSMKSALDALCAQLVADPDLDLEAYGAELVALFERATRPDPDPSRQGTAPPTGPARSGSGQA
jgi:TetR/AcrR family transcriptional regulator, fatty acid metabolism regulator protein